MSWSTVAVITDYLRLGGFIKNKNVLLIIAEAGEFKISTTVSGGGFFLHHHVAEGRRKGKEHPLP